MPSAALLPPAVAQEKDGYRLTLRVEGVRCAKCIYAIESALKKQAGVIDARVNMSTSRLSVLWQGEPGEAERFTDIVEKLGYTTRIPGKKDSSDRRQEETALLRAMAIAGFAMGNIMLLSVALWSSEMRVMGMATRELLHLLSALIALPTIIYAGRPFFASALLALKAGRTNMDVPISLGLILASALSLSETFRGGEHAFFDSAVMLLFFLLIGRWLDAKARSKAGRHARDLLEMLQGTASLLDENGQTRRVAIRDLAPGDSVLVAAGEKAPTDAVVEKGASDVDTSSVTGESLPRPAKAGDIIYGGSINLSAPLVCRVLEASENSLLAEAVRLMEQAEQGRARYVRLADKAARLYTPVVHILAAAGFAGWFFFGGAGWRDALTIAVTTLIITCPCALGLAVPAVQVLAVEWLMKRGVLVKSGDALERLAEITAVVFDKTGTLTCGRPALQTGAAVPEHAALAAALASHSKHPLSRAIDEATPKARPVVENIAETPGSGVSGVYNGAPVFLGRSEKGTALSIGDKIVAQFSFTDDVRQGAADAVQAFAQEGAEIYLLSGDARPIVEELAEKLGIMHARGEMLPGEKVAFIKKLQQEGARVLMVGDGLNDAPALAQANVSMSPSTGIDVTQNAADAVFCGESLRAVFLCRKMAVFSSRLVKQNFALAALYNCLAVPLALAGMVTPLVAAVAMSASSLLVIGNAFRIRLVKDGAK